MLYICVCVCVCVLEVIFKEQSIVQHTNSTHSKVLIKDNFQRSHS